MIRVNRESANRLLEEAQMLVNENKKGGKNVDDLRKKREGYRIEWKKRHNHKSCSDNKKSRK